MRGIACVSSNPTADPLHTDGLYRNQLCQMLSQVPQLGGLNRRSGVLGLALTMNSTGSNEHQPKDATVTMQLLAAKLARF